MHNVFHCALCMCMHFNLSVFRTIELGTILQCSCAKYRPYEGRQIHIDETNVTKAMEENKMLDISVAHFVVQTVKKRTEFHQEIVN